MGAFGGEPKTVNGGFSAATDNKTPAFGSLPAASMTSLSGLAGTTGTDVKLIHGDRWQQIDGLQKETINKTLTTDILETETWTVHDNLIFKVIGTTTDHRIEDVKEYYLAESRFEYFGEHTDQHHEQDHQLNPTVTFDVLHTEGEYKNIDLAIKALVFEAKGAVVDVTVGKAEAWGVGAEAWGAGVGAGGFKNEAVACDVGEKETKAELHGIRAEIAALNSQVGATRTIIMPVRIGICIAIHIDSPWA
jgi:hypothetical protein